MTIYIDNENIGMLENSADTISDCGEEFNITKELSVGEHSYKVEIRPESGNGCTKDINGTLTISENKCEKIFIDYLQIFSSQSDCDQNVIISETEYRDAISDPFSITKIEIIENCLNITFSASGCDGSTWEIKLIDSRLVVESNPCQRSLKLILQNKEICTAVPSKEISFNIEDLQIEGNDKTTLNISGEMITYEY